MDHIVVTSGAPTPEELAAVVVALAAALGGTRAGPPVPDVPPTWWRPEVHRAPGSWVVTGSDRRVA
jgi:hypothetical protein